MKLFLLLAFYLVTASESGAQENTVQKLPPGKYETKVMNSTWERGDIILLDGEKYKISSSPEIGEYRFSVTAQRIFFTSGSLKGIFALAKQQQNAPVILIPQQENESLGLKLAAADIVCRLKF
jgi:hypothetical protein